MRLIPLSAAVLAVFSLTISSCKQDTPDVEPTPTPVPDTYDFPYVNYSGQTERLDQFEELMAYIETSNESGVQLDRQVLADMFANTNGDGNGNFTFTSTKNIEDKCFEPDLPVFNDYFDRIVLASKSTDTATNGVAGVMYNEDGSSGRLFDANGFELAEVIEKHLMGALCYYQATSVYLSDEKMEVDNEEVDEEKGTDMAHHWDEAYGYLGVSNDFPENTEDVRFWGKYCVRRDALIHSVDSLSSAFRRGRAGITWHRYEERDQAIADVREHWENVCAASALHYFNEALANFDNDLTRNHVLSEAYGFVQSLFYNPERRVTQAQIEQLTELIGDNLYEVSSTDLQAARDILAEVYGWESIKTSF